MAGTTTLGEAQIPIRATLDQLDSDLSNAKSKVASAMQNVQNVGKVAGTAVAMAFTGATVAVTAWAKVAGDASKLAPMRDAFERNTKTVDENTNAVINNSETILQAMKDASHGMMSEAELMAGYNEAILLGGKEQAQLYIDLLPHSYRIAAEAGKEMTLVQDELSLGTARQSAEVLNNNGVIVKAEEVYKAYAESLGKTVDELTAAERQAAFGAGTINSLNEKFKDAPEVVETAAMKIDQFKVSMENTRDEIGTKSLEAFDSFAEAGLLIAEKILPILVEKFDEIIPVITNIASGIADFVKSIIDGQEPIDTFKTLISELFPKDTADIINGVLTEFGEWWEIIKQISDPIADFIEQNVKLQDVLIVLAIAIGSVVLPMLWGIITAAAPLIGTFLLMVGVVAALRTAWEKDFLGIRSAATDAWEKIKPALEQLKEWLGENIPKAIETLRQWWENTLLPAMENVQNWIEQNLVPLFEALGELLEVTLGIAITAAAGFWQNVLQPALEDFIVIAKDAWDWLKNKLTPAFGGISDAIGKVVDWIKNLTEKLKDIKLPDWLTPGSPTPFEIGLLGIGEALQKLSSTRLPAFKAGLELTEPDLGMLSSINGSQQPSSQTQHNYNITANYKYQDEMTLTDQLKIMNLLGGVA